ncbi:hypothetical protein [Primorskyibacter flagellatus]|uniref:Uncharacterized protein n=1 Tax=Primorskyibacter flagellatus TaxID=1387277 RepID=A0A1W2ECW2_9RHOB|nr:hypothetical protein [Primorskyibacter flagellatus]SMD07232.1 hypothetical protein SAMN06295998_1267 [Primorskyibacter flagellatus]
MAFQPTPITQDRKEARTFARSMHFCAKKGEPGRAITLAEAG